MILVQVLSKFVLVLLKIIIVLHLPGNIADACLKHVIETTQAFTNEVFEGPVDECGTAIVP